MAFSQGYVFGFAAAICVVCSLAISGVSLGLRDLQQANARRDLQGNILQALAVEPPAGKELSGPLIDQLWEERVEIQPIVAASGERAEGSEWDLDGDGDVDEDDVTAAREEAKEAGGEVKLMAVYARKDQGGKIGAIALPMYGKGLWGPISAYIALDAQAREVTGATFFAPKETPGLGAEIQEPKFEQQWLGKRIVDDAGATRTIQVVKGEAAVLCSDDIEHCVDGVSGATITSRGVDVMVAEALEVYEPYLNRVRGR